MHRRIRRSLEMLRLSIVFFRAARSSSCPPVLLATRVSKCQSADTRRWSTPRQKKRWLVAGEGKGRATSQRDQGKEKKRRIL
jgi:hypothetical protein